MKQTGIIIILLLSSWASSSCSHGKGETADKAGDTIEMRYAELLEIIRYKDYTKVTIRDPWKSGRTLHTYEIRKPYKRMVVYTAIHTSLFHELSVTDHIAGVCDTKYITAQWVHELCRTGKIIDCGNAMNPDIEKVIQAKPDAILLSPFENSGGYGKVEELGIPIIEAADYMETSALGRAEWIKFYGILTGKEREAERIFSAIEKKYNAVKRTNRKQNIKVLTDKKQGSAWYVPGGGSTFGQMIADAGGLYAFAGDKRSGSIPLSLETMIEKNLDADVWLIKYNSKKDLTLSELAKENDAYRMFKAFKKGNVYGCNTSYVPFYEEVPFHPERLLEDYDRIFASPDSAHGLRYYKRLKVGSINSPNKQ